MIERSDDGKMAGTLKNKSIMPKKLELNGSRKRNGGNEKRNCRLDCGKCRSGHEAQATDLESDRSMRDGTWEVEDIERGPPSRQFPCNHSGMAFWSFDGR